MSNFFPLKRGDRLFLIALVAFTVVSFLPWSRRIVFAGMSLFGWLMAVLMVLSPTYVLIRVFLEGRKRDKRDGMK
ncbi:MAG: hypothetical protein JXB23_02890 [Candidatus Aminicenantes bacterium]|nr:hypothetical protein [Candidatus Aminicenantes bacterium]